MIKNFGLGLLVILVLSGFASAQKVVGAWRLDEVTTTGTDARRHTN